MNPIDQLSASIESAARALGVVGRWRLTVTHSGPGTWWIRDGQSTLASYLTVSGDTLYGVARGIQAAMVASSVRVRPEMGDGDPPLHASVLFESVQSPTVHGGGFDLECVTPPPFDLTGDHLVDALALLCFALPDTDERCPDCVRRSLPGRKLAMWEWAAVVKDAAGKWHGWSTPSGLLDERGYIDDWTLVIAPLGHGPPRYASRPCPTCTVNGEPTGRVPRSWASVLLGALPMPWPHGSDAPCPRGCSPCSCDTNPETTDGPDYECPHHGVDTPAVECSACLGRGTILVGNRDDRSALAVKADELQASTRKGQTGDDERDLGEWLALMLADQPCSACDSRRTKCPCDRSDHIDGAGCGACMNTGQLTDDPCRPCGGDGRELARHTEAIAAALDRLTSAMTHDPV